MKIFLIIFSLAPFLTLGQSLKQRIEAHPSVVSVETYDAPDHFSEAWHIAFKQPLDHKNPSAGHIEQQIYLFHSKYDAPTTMETCGYKAYVHTNELSKITQGNLAIIENRYFGSSKPAEDIFDWKYLRYQQSLKDLHEVNQFLRTIYTGPYLSSGVSKGGANCISYRYAYPNDVDVTVPYVAPIALEREDPRTQMHIESISTNSNRAKVNVLQKRILLERDSLTILLDAWAKKNKKTYRNGYDAAIDYAALEYPFSFWQWGGDTTKLDVDMSTSQLFKHVNGTVGWDFYSDQTVEYLGPSFYQHMVELGYYGFDTTSVSHLLKDIKSPDNLYFTPAAESIPGYDGSYMQNVWEFATNHGNRFIYIYGEFDTWSACAIYPKPELDALLMVLKGGNHGTRIRHFSEADKAKIYDKLEKWLQAPVFKDKL